MDPISRSPTNNDVVRETMIRTMNVTNEMGPEYGIVTYDLQVALKVYCPKPMKLRKMGNTFPKSKKKSYHHKSGCSHDQLQPGFHPGYEVDLNIDLIIHR